MKKVTRGSEIIDAPHLVKEVVELHMNPKQRWETIGFRLAYDDGGESCSGSPWDSKEIVVRPMTRINYGPLVSADSLGFRLARPLKG